MRAEIKPEHGNMAQDNNKPQTKPTFQLQNVDFNLVSTIAEEWMLDFMFLRLCRNFMDGKRDEFKGTLKRLHDFQGDSKVNRRSLRPQCAEKIMIIALLARIMHAKQLDMRFEQDQQTMPLMSAVKIWTELEETVKDRTLYVRVTLLLVVQSVALCLEKGQTSAASLALKWFEKNVDFPKSMSVKISSVISRGDAYHPILMSFSSLMEAVQVYLEAYLLENPSDYLLQEAIKAAQSRSAAEDLEDSVSRENSASASVKVEEQPTEIAAETRAKGTCLKTKRKLCSTRLSEVWRQDTSKRTKTTPDKVSKPDAATLVLPTEKAEKPVKTEKTTEPRRRRRWTPQLDKYLRDGVAHHGTGRWARILLDYDFEGRTGTMLKDRWRILIKTEQTSEIISPDSA